MNVYLIVGKSKKKKEKKKNEILTINFLHCIIFHLATESYLVFWDISDKLLIVTNSIQYSHVGVCQYYDKLSLKLKWLPDIYIIGIQHCELVSIGVILNNSYHLYNFRTSLWLFLKMESCWKTTPLMKCEQMQKLISWRNPHKVLDSKTIKTRVIDRPLTCSNRANKKKFKCI